jgi:predicted TIM-barrel fold metal-dependent hydrolase
VESAVTCVDIHSHFAPPQYVTAVVDAASANSRLRDLLVRNRFLTQSPTGVAGPSAALTDLGRRLGDMDDAGVDVAALAVPPPGPNLGSSRAAIRHTRNTNDALVKLAEAHPRRLRVFASLPLPHVAAATAELERIAAHNLVRGLQLMTVAEKYSLDQPEFEPIFQRAAELRMPILLHPALESMPSAYADFGLTASLAPVISSSLGALRLVLSGILDRVPTLELIIPHLGGVVPYIAQRVVDLSGHGNARFDLLHYLRDRIYLDTCSHHPPALAAALATTPPDRLVLGSDAPFRGSLRRAVEYVSTSSLDGESRKRVLGLNALRWLA